MEQKTWKQRLLDGEKIKDIVFSEPVMDINSWLEKCKTEGLNDIDENYILRCADRFNRISFEVISPAEFAKQWKKTVRI
jgi:hypothetical protein